MVESKVLFFGVFAILVASMFLVSAVQFTEVGSVTNPDNFYSPYETWINVSTNATVTGAGDSIISVKANFTAINTTACGNGYLALSYVNGNWIGNCSVSSFFTNASQITPIQKNITFVVENSTGNFSSLQQFGAPVVILLHNLGVPNMSDPTGCTRFGAKTTNLSSTAVTNFANVSYYAVHVQVNYTCATSGAFNGTIPGAFNDALLINLTSINMSASDIGTKLSNLRTTVQVNITRPRTFGASRIDVNTTAFSELNTDARVTLYYVPIVYWDIGTSVTGENIGKLMGIGNDGANGYSSALGISSWNVTLVVMGFSGYNVTDNNAPIISVVTPGTAKNLTNFILNVSVNGTGTELSKVYINITNSSGQVNFTIYNTSVNTSNCNPTSLGGDFYYCTLNLTFAEGNYTLNVTAWDYGGASPGNIKSVSQGLYIDTTAPVVSIPTPSHTETTMNLTLSITESGSGISSCTSTRGTASGSGTSWRVYESSLTCETYYTYNVTCTDNAGNSASDSENHATSTCSDEDGGDGGSGGSETSTSFWTSTFSPTDTQFRTGYNKQLKKGERIKVKVGNETHYVGIIKLTSSKATINISSTPQQVILEVNETEKFEVTNDSYYDISVTLNRVNSTNANVTVKSVYELMSESARTTAVTSGNNETTSNLTGTSDETQTSTPLYKNKWFWIALGVIVVAGAGAWFGYRRWRHSRKAKGFA